MYFSCPLVFSSSHASFAYLALDTSTALHSLYVSQLSLNMYYILSTQTVDKLLIDFQYHKQKSFIRCFLCILNNLMSELFLIITLILYFHLVCLIINNSYSYAVNPCFSKLNTWHNTIFQGFYPYYVSEHDAKRLIILSRAYLFYSLLYQYHMMKDMLLCLTLFYMNTCIILLL